MKVYYSFITLFFICCSCYTKESNIKVLIDEIYVSYYPSRNSYDVDSVRLRILEPVNNTKIEKVVVDFRDTLKFKSQSLVLSDNLVFVNAVYNGANKPFIWNDPFVNSFDVSLDSVRRYLKTYIIKNNIFSTYTTKYGKSKVEFFDTSKIHLKELYGGL
ncbi:hypothetical protein [Leadbetterella sp. DM7]|uniref:hypothetical protein n=1 Tax=Leadbetterella sp. DM7 TaxID=3235085 RepID=UPI00349E4A84